MESHGWGVSSCICRGNKYCSLLHQTWLLKNVPQRNETLFLQAESGAPPSVMSLLWCMSRVEETSGPITAATLVHFPFWLPFVLLVYVPLVRQLADLQVLWTLHCVYALYVECAWISGRRLNSKRALSEVILGVAGSRYASDPNTPVDPVYPPEFYLLADHVRLSHSSLR